MDKDLQHRFDRLDAALSTLVESLAAYNPSPAAAASLVTADDNLTEGLERLATHQRNHHEIQSLRSVVDSLDSHVKTTLLRLSEMRRDLLAFNLESGSNANSSREVHHDQLLSYAQQISRFTVPPTHKPPLPPSIGEPIAGQRAAPTGRTGSNTAQQEPNTELGVEYVPELDSPKPLTPPERSHLESRAEAEGKAMAALPPAVRAWLEPPSVNMPFMPWPDEDRVRVGALGVIEDLRDRGLDPSQSDPGFAVADSGNRM